MLYEMCCGHMLKTPLVPEELPANTPFDAGTYYLHHSNMIIVFIQSLLFNLFYQVLVSRIYHLSLIFLLNRKILVVIKAYEYC